MITSKRASTTAAANDDPLPPLRLNHRLFVPKLTPRQAASFAEFAPAALWVAGNLDGVQPIRLGDNRVAWPVTMGLTQAWADFKSPQLRADDPYHERAVLARHWCQTWDDADRLWCAVYAALAGRFDEARGEWMYFAPGTKLADINACVATVWRQEGVRQMQACPNCLGSKHTTVLTTATTTPPRIVVHERPCFTCRGAGEIHDAHAERIAGGKILRDARGAVDVAV